MGVGVGWCLCLVVVGCGWGWLKCDVHPSDSPCVFRVFGLVWRGVVCGVKKKKKGVGGGCGGCHRVLCCGLVVGVGMR